jgi:hypothetical protein
MLTKERKMLRKSSIKKSSRLIDVKVLQKLVVAIDEQNEELFLGGSLSRNDENNLRLKYLNTLEIVPTVPICAACEYHSGSYR